MSYIYNPYIYYNFADDVYRDNGTPMNMVYATPVLPPGWLTIDMPDYIPQVQVNNWQTGGYNSYNNGYYGRAYYNVASGDIVIAHRGTETNDIGDLSADLTLGAQNLGYGGWNSQFDSAHNFSNYVKQTLSNAYPGVDFNVVQTGHSLGGAIAQIETARDISEQSNPEFSGQTYPQFTERAFSYDNPGVTTIIRDHFGEDVLNKASAQSVEVLAPPNLVNSIDDHHGQVFQEEPGQQGASLEGHHMYNILNKLDPTTGLPVSTQQATDDAAKKYTDDVLNGKTSSNINDDPLNKIMMHGSSPAANSGISPGASGSTGITLTSNSQTGTTQDFHFESYYTSIEQGIQKLLSNLSHA